MENNILEKIIKNKKAEELGKLDAIKVANGLFEELLERERDVLVRRFGLHGSESETLEKIGKLHKLTRERVRQIEATSIKKLKKIENLESSLGVIRGAVDQLLTEHGGLMERDYLLDVLTVFCIDPTDNDKKELYKKHFDFLISKLLDDSIEKVGQSDSFNSVFRHKNNDVTHLEEIGKELNKEIDKQDKTLNIEELFGLLKQLSSYEKNNSKITDTGKTDMLDVFKNEVFPESGEVINANKVLYSLVSALKDVDRNKFGHWGKSDWPEIKPKKISDKIYLVLKQSGAPMHFTEIAEKINEVAFDKKKANSGTVHNELILDDRYVLVDRGRYGLKEWQKQAVAA
ncbi:MAG: sigma factor-like helix-turn-helix DNA-binding protein [Candidatus Falkowbacteria bacterium]